MLDGFRRRRRRCGEVRKAAGSGTVPDCGGGGFIGTEMAQVFLVRGSRRRYRQGRRGRRSKCRIFKGTISRSRSAQVGHKATSFGKKRGALYILFIREYLALRALRVFRPIRYPAVCKSGQRDGSFSRIKVIFLNSR